MKTTGYTKSGSSPPRPVRRWTTPGFHADTRKPDEREVPDHAFISKMEEGRQRWTSAASGAHGGRPRRFVMFVPSTRYRPEREEAAWNAEILRLLDEAPPVDVNDSVPTERFERPPSIDTGTWGLLLAIDVRGEKLSDAMRRMGIAGKAAMARTRKKVERARKAWAIWRAQPSENTTMSQNERTAP